MSPAGRGKVKLAPISPAGRGRRGSAADINRRQQYTKKADKKKKDEKKAVEFFSQPYQGRRGSTGSMASPQDKIKARRSSQAEKYKHMGVMQNKGINYTHQERIRNVARRQSAFDTTAKMQAINKIKGKSAREKAKPDGHEYQMQKKKEELESLMRKERARGVQSDVIGGGLMMPSILLDPNSAPELLQKQLAKKDKAKLEQRKKDAAVSMKWDGKLGKFIEVENSANDRSAFCCCSRAAERGKKDRKKMKAKAENGCVDCLVGIPRCLKDTVKKLLFCVAGLVQCIVCMPKLMDKAEMQTQINPEK
jgi:hypothetical protein